MSVPKFWLYLYDRLAGLPCSPGSTGDLCGNLSANCGTAAGRGVTISGSPCGAECGLPSRFFCARTRAWERSAVRSMACRQRVEHPVCAGRNVRSEWNGTSGLRGAEYPVGGGGLCGGGAGHAPQVSRAGGGMSRSADGGSRRRPCRDLPSEVPAGRGKDSGKRVASAAAHCWQRPGSGGRRIPASEEKQKAVFVRKPLLSYDRMRYSLSGVTLT